MLILMLMIPITDDTNDTDVDVGFKQKVYHKYI